MGYVGQTCRDVRKRCQRGNYHVGTKIRQAFDDYGPDNFVCIVLEDGLTKEEVNEREQYWISFFHTTESGYNVTYGGTGVLGARWKYPHSFSDEHRQKLSESSKGYVATEETRQRLSQSLRGIPHPWKEKKVQQLTKDGQFVAEYPSAMEAERQTGIDRGAISGCCLNRLHYHTAGGYKWRFADSN